MMKSTNKIAQNENSASENLINDLAIDEYGKYLYIAAGNSVKIWDIKQLEFIYHKLIRFELKNIKNFLS